MISEDGWCHKCTELGFNNCERCKIDIDNFNEFVCSKCSVGYFLNKDGYCEQCENPLVQGIHNTCVKCNDTDEGGIEGCEKCVSDNGKIYCQQCQEGFILNEKNQKCIKISEDSKLEKFINCQRVLLDNNNNNYYCSKCRENYNLLKENDETLCVNNNYIVTPKFDLLKYCKDSINIGTEDKPWHSCNKCIGNDELTQEQRENGISFKRIIYNDNKTAYCDLSKNYKSLDNCTEAIRKVENNELIYTCNKCAEGNNLLHYADQNLDFCTYFHYEKTCMVKNCKTCKKGNNYFCTECMLENYEVNPVTGSCIKKMEKVPIITWKDTFRYKLNHNMTINEQEIFGPSVTMRGITTDLISEGHAFTVTLTFKILYTRGLRNVEEEENVKAICIITNGIDRTNDISLVEYECIGNRTGKNNFTEDNNIHLENIKLGQVNDNNNDDKDIKNNEKNDEFLKSSNFEEMLSKVNYDEINKTESTYTINDLLNTTKFTLEDIVDQVSDSYKFNFKLNGKINKDLPKQTIEAKLQLREIKNKTANCKFNIGDNKGADLDCDIDLEGYEELKQFSFRTTEIEGSKPIYLSQLDEVKLIHKDKDEKEEKKKADIIKIVLIVAAVVLVTGAIVGFIFIKRILNKNNRKKDITTSNIETNKNEDNLKTTDIIKNSENSIEASTRRVVKNQKGNINN